MTPWLSDPDVTLYHGDALDVLRGLPDGSVDCCVTSPPYWGLRDYGIGGQLGLEPTPDEYVARMVTVFREVRRVLADHGTCWVNLGDSYVSVPGGQRQGDRGQMADRSVVKARAQVKDTKAAGGALAQRPPSVAGLKPKDLVGIPWRIAFALQADGWYLRSDIVWAKPNPMPESVTDRPTKSHEYVFLLTKRPRYFFDQEAVREDYEGDPEYRYGRVGAYQNRAILGVGDGTTPTSVRGPDGRRKTTVKGADGSIQHRDGERWPNAGRNVRSVWTIATQPYPEAHFATFPEELARRCIVAGCPERVCRECGKPSERIIDVERGGTSDRNGSRFVGDAGPRGTNFTGKAYGSDTRGAPSRTATTVGWSDCGHNAYRPGLVIDPFIGSGTVAKVARDHQRHAIGIDLNEQYLQLAARRLQQLTLLNEATA